MCAKVFKKIGYIDWKIVAFEVKNKLFFHLARKGQQTLNPLGLKL
jgi:hypothetical protein